MRKSSFFDEIKVSSLWSEFFPSSKKFDEKKFSSLFEAEVKQILETFDQNPKSFVEKGVKSYWNKHVVKPSNVIHTFIHVLQALTLHAAWNSFLKPWHGTCLTSTATVYASFLFDLRCAALTLSDMIFALFSPSLEYERPLRRRRRTGPLRRKLPLEFAPTAPLQRADLLMGLARGERRPRSAAGPREERNDEALQSRAAPERALRLRVHRQGCVNC